MKTIQISFNYDPELLKAAGVDLDSGTLNELRGLLLARLAKRTEDPRMDSKQRALVAAFTQE